MYICMHIFRTHSKHAQQIGGMGCPMCGFTQPISSTKTQKQTWKDWHLVSLLRKQTRIRIICKNNEELSEQTVPHIVF